MYIDGRTLDNGTLIEGDICIVGAGAAGISMALEWINTPHKVILLEGGGFQPDEKVQELYDGKETGQPYYPLIAMRLHYFGGTTGHWAGFCSPFEHIDFIKRDWMPISGWPIKRDDLDPFYARSQGILDLGPYDYSVKYWRNKDPELIPLLTDNSVIWNKMWQFSKPIPRFGQKYKDTIVNAKNIHLYTYSNVTDITANKSVSQIKEVTVKNYAGKEHKVRAKIFVLACGAIQNSRMLLASNKQAAKGLGNDNDLVGRHFMEHIEIFGSGELWLKKPDALKLYIRNPDTRVRAELAVTEKQQTEHRILNGTISVSPLLTESEKSLPPNSVYPAFQLITRIEQVPNPLSRVTLSADTDSLGVPRATLHWQLSALEKRSIRKIYELLGQQVGIEGVARVKMSPFLQDENDTSWPSYTGGGQHHMGTTRMSDNPKEGVVDANCKVNNIANLYIAGSSCFATGGAQNPTLSIVALTLRLSDHLKQKMKGKA
jgi:choline dehydrogenase-like flavoprotein